MIDFFKIFLWKVFYFDHDFSTFWETTSLRDFSFSFRQKTFFSWKNFLFWRKKRGKNSNFLSIFLVKIQFIIWKESLNFWKKWVFNLLVVREVTVFFDIENNYGMKRAPDWIKIMKSKYSIIIKIITSEVDLYLFLQRRFWGVDVNLVRISSCDNRTKYAPHFGLDFLCPLPWLFGWTFCVLWKFEWKIRIEINIFFFWWNFSHFLWIFPCKMYFLVLKMEHFWKWKKEITS